MTDMELKGKWALVTGASSGLGTSFAHRLAARGANLILVARREERLNAVRAGIMERFAVEVEVIPMDLTAHDAPAVLHERITGAGRQVDVLVNNAGFGAFGTFLDIPWEKERTMLELDIVALVHMTRLFAKDMVARGSGWILQVASTGAYQPTPLFASYAAAKSFVLNFGEAIHYELRGTGVSCTVLSPGVTRTEFHEVAGQSYGLYHRVTAMDPDRVAEIGIRAMLKRKPSVVAGRLNALFAWGASRIMPRRMVLSLAYRLMR